LTAHQKKAISPVVIQNFVLKNLREICFALYCSHPDCLKLPHAEKQSENVEFKSELAKKKKLLSGGSEWPSLL